MPSLSRKTIQPLIRLALREDRATHDITSRAVLLPSQRLRARVIAKASGVVAGGPIAAWIFHTLDPSLRCVLTVHDGAHVKRGQAILTIEGRAPSIFAAERTALNVLGHLSGIATLTHHYVQRLRGTHAVILDTRKTLPGLRALEKYAVRVGGGQNHRTNLAEAILMKTNHLRALGQGARDKGQGNSKRLIQEVVLRARRVRPKRFVEVEVTNLSEYKTALLARPDALLLDNWRLTDIRKAVLLKSPLPRAARPTPLLEVSGGVTLSNVRAIAATGVDRISIGRLTHSAPALDLSLKVM